MQDFSDLVPCLIFFYLSNFRDKLLLCRLTLDLWWAEKNLIGQFFLVGSHGDICMLFPCKQQPPV